MDFYLLFGIAGSGPKSGRRDIEAILEESQMRSLEYLTGLILQYSSRQDAMNIMYTYMTPSHDTSIYINTDFSLQS